jgi:hypothetical protein
MSSQISSFNVYLTLPYFSCSIVEHSFSPNVIFGYSFDAEDISEKLPTYTQNPLWKFDGSKLVDLDSMILSEMDYTIVP